MAATNAICFPIYGQPYRVICAFRDISGNLLTGWGSAAATAYPDLGAGSAATIVESPANSGIGYIDLTGTQMTCTSCTVVATISNTNWTAFVSVINPLNLSQFTGRYDAQSIQLFERMVMDLYSGIGLNGASQTGAALNMLNPDGSTHFASSVVQNTTSGVRSKMS